MKNSPNLIARYLLVHAHICCRGRDRSSLVHSIDDVLHRGVDSCSPGLMRDLGSATENRADGGPMQQATRAGGTEYRTTHSLCKTGLQATSGKYVQNVAHNNCLTYEKKCLKLCFVTNATRTRHSKRETNKIFHLDHLRKRTVGMNG